METRNLKTSLNDLLKTTSLNVYEYTRVPKSATFPYITYNLVNSIESDRDAIEDVDFVLEIDIFDYRLDKDTTNIDNAVDTVSSLLNRASIITDGFVYDLTRTGFLPQLPTINEHTFRRQITFVLEYMEKGA